MLSVFWCSFTIFVKFVRNACRCTVMIVDNLHEMPSSIDTHTCVILWAVWCALSCEAKHRTTITKLRAIGCYRLRYIHVLSAYTFRNLRYFKSIVNYGMHRPITRARNIDSVLNDIAIPSGFASVRHT